MRPSKLVRLLYRTDEEQAFSRCLSELLVERWLQQQLASTQSHNAEYLPGEEARRCQRETSMGLGALRRGYRDLSRPDKEKGSHGLLGQGQSEEFEHAPIGVRWGEETSFEKLTDAYEVH